MVWFLIIFFLLIPSPKKASLSENYLYSCFSTYETQFSQVMQIYSPNPFPSCPISIFCSLPIIFVLILNVSDFKMKNRINFSIMIGQTLENAMFAWCECFPKYSSFAAKYMPQSLHMQLHVPLPRTSNWNQKCQVAWRFSKL